MLFLKFGQLGEGKWSREGEQSANTLRAAQQQEGGDAKGERVTTLQTELRRWAIDLPLGLPAGWTAEPIVTVAPESTADVVEIVRLAEAAGAALIPCGGGTHWQTGYPPATGRPWVCLSTARLHRLLDYQPDDLTITCEPGMPLATLQNHLAERRQMLALDAPYAPHVTMGGLVATNTAGLWRPAYGTPRDLLIGLRAVMHQGVEVKGGGRVVKNVAGYDVCKLFTGAWGTLGILTELTFRVRTRPDVERTVAWEAPNLETAARVGLALHHACLAGTYFLATNELGERPQILVGLQGSEERVTWQTKEYARRVQEAGIAPRSTLLTEAEVATLRDRQGRCEPETPLAARFACLPAELPELARQLQDLPGMSLTLHCATGTVSLGTLDASLERLRKIEAGTPAGANRVWTRLPADLLLRDDIALWGEARETMALHRALKQALDPQNTFSPGRFLGRL